MTIKSSYSIQMSHSSDTDDMWQRVAELAKSLDIKDYASASKQADLNFLPQGSSGIYGLGPGDTIETNKKCDHKWIEVGFTHIKTVCKHCDIEQK